MRPSHAAHASRMPPPFAAQCATTPAAESPNEYLRLRQAAHDFFCLCRLAPLYGSPHLLSSPLQSPIRRKSGNLSADSTFSSRTSSRRSRRGIGHKHHLAKDDFGDKILKGFHKHLLVAPLSPAETKCYIRSFNSRTREGATPAADSELMLTVFQFTHP